MPSFFLSLRCSGCEGCWALPLGLAAVAPGAPASSPPWEATQRTVLSSSSCVFCLLRLNLVFSFCFLFLLIFFFLSHFWFFLQNNLPNLDYFRAAAHPEKSPSYFSFNHPIIKRESWMALRKKKEEKKKEKNCS